MRRSSGPGLWAAWIGTIAVVSAVACSEQGETAPPDEPAAATPPADHQAQLFRRRRERRNATVPDVSRVELTSKSYSGPLPELTADQKKLADELKRDVTVLATDIGERNVFRNEAYMKAAKFLKKQLADAGYKVETQTVRARGVDCFNIEAELLGSTKPKEIVVIGAHYDSVSDCPAANDNGSGVAATLALARRFVKTKPERTLRFVLFANEEMPFFHREGMGSLAYARRCKSRKENVKAMFSLETMGYFSDKAGSQHYPAPLNLMYPSTGNFIGFVGNVESAALVKQAVDGFRKHAKFPSEGAALPSAIPGVGWSDHWSFWQAGYPAVMVTDTAPFRYPHYHERTDTPDKLQFDRMARVVEGLEKVIGEIAGVK